MGIEVETRVINPTAQSEELLFSTVRIESANAANEVGIGTGFFFQFTLEGKGFLPLLITNNHVIEKSVTGRFHLHEAMVANDGRNRPSGKSFVIVLDNFEQRWIPHPDPEIDLCALPLGTIQKELPGTKYSISLDPRNIRSDSELEALTAAEEVLMIGYPIGLWDDVNNLPIIRRGITATHPAVDFRGKSLGVIDAACFPGSSGSPVFIQNQGAYLTKQGPAVGSRTILLGVLFAGPYLDTDGKIEMRHIPTTTGPTIVTPIMIHLGYIIKAKEILALGQHIIDGLNVSGQI